MKKVILLAFAVLAAVAAFYVAEGFLDAMLHGGSSASFARRLAATARQMNAGLPRQVNNETRMDTIVAGPGNRLTCVCTLINLSSTNFDRKDFTAKVKPALIDGYKARPGMQALRKEQVELHDQYRDKDGNEVATIVISTKDF